MTEQILWAGYPKSYTPGRARPIQFVTWHYTAGSEGPSSAESGAQYDKTRTDGTSTHYFVDSLGPALQEVPDGDRAHAARFHGNEVGIQIEICGTAQSRAGWLDAVSYPTLVTTAWLTAQLLRRHNLAFHRLTVNETRAAYYNPAGQRPTGINDHNAITLAFPEDQGTHTDMGPDFPWDVAMDLVGKYLSGGVAGMAQMVIHNNDDGKYYLVDGMFRRELRPDQIDPGKISNSGVHQSGLLGPLGNGGAVFNTSGDMDVWGALYPFPVSPAPVTPGDLETISDAAHTGAEAGAREGITGSTFAGTITAS